jgi:hypothetical protein
MGAEWHRIDITVHRNRHSFRSVLITYFYSIRKIYFKNIGIFITDKKISITFAIEHWTCSNNGLGCPRLKKGYRFGWLFFYFCGMTFIIRLWRLLMRRLRWMSHLFSMLSINDFCEKAQFSFMQNYKVLFFRQINTDYFEQLPAFCAIHCLLII